MGLTLASASALLSFSATHRRDAEVSGAFFEADEAFAAAERPSKDTIDSPTAAMVDVLAPLLFWQFPSQFQVQGNVLCCDFEI